MRAGYRVGKSRVEARRFATWCLVTSDLQKEGL